MKVLVVLVLAAFTGCNANIFYADEPKPQIELLTDAFWDYVAMATETADDSLQIIKKSQFGQDVSERLREYTGGAFRSVAVLHEQLPPAARDMIQKVTTETELLMERVDRDLSTVKDTLKPYTKEMHAQIQERVEQLKQELAPYAESVDTESLRATLAQKTEEMKQSVRDLQAQLGPFTDDMKLKVDQHLQDFQERVDPLAQQVRGQVIERAQQVQEMATPYVEDLKVKLDPYTQDLQARLTTLYETYIKSN
ncbi:hypothetical protein PBY51_017330 [Eleginops maclovinus]|uniref:Apolipoprotein A-IV n=2 Tax=Eleginops maclovinus TaxID=56733 RepID=A0AAN7XK83_ELEMC|nr:hypothetical protein PBY51_017330 [Eleginops maclovinus]